MNLDGLSPEAAAALYRLDEMTGGNMKSRITSAYRSPEHNAKVGGAKHSQHIHGNAFDFNVSDMSEAERLALIEQAREAGFRGVGVYDNALHFDVGPERAWGPSYSSDSLPAWYTGAQPAQGGSAPPQQMAQSQNKMAEFMQLASMMPKWRNSLRG